jgi:MoaA/NifB/PqqE/SkfB family radical SAM enzyme
MPIQLTKNIGENFCYAPWTNIHINPEGTYKTCCGGTVDLADLRSTSIQQVVNSPVLRSIKQNILDNRQDPNCTNCIRQEQMSSTSERGWYDDISARQTITINDITTQHLQNLDIRWSNTCNLSCTYCGPDASSQWASMRKIPFGRLDYTQTMSSILKLIDENKNTLKNLGLLGGEPLLQKENDLLLDVIADHVHINVITNLSVPLDNNRIFNKLLEKRNVMWDISFDTIEDKFEYVRHGASWDNQVKNIRYLQKSIQNKPGHKIGVASVYSIYNALELSNVHDYFKRNNLPTMRWNELHHPSMLAVSNLPGKFRMRAIEELQKSIDYHTWHRQRNFLNDMAKNLENVTNTNNDCKYLVDWHLEQEKTCWPTFQHKFSELWPEYSECF